MCQKILHLVIFSEVYKLHSVAASHCSKYRQLAVHRGADHQSMHKSNHNKDQVGFNFEQNFALKVCNFPLHPAKDARAHSCNLSMLIFLEAAEGHRVRDQSVKTIHLFNFHTQSFILLQVPHSSIRAPAAVMLSLEVSSEFCSSFSK